VIRLPLEVSFQCSYYLFPIESASAVDFRYLAGPSAAWSGLAALFRCTGRGWG
jgi:hypothetical protein